MVSAGCCNLLRLLRMLRRVAAIAVSRPVHPLLRPLVRRQAASIAPSPAHQPMNSATSPPVSLLCSFSLASAQPRNQAVLLYSSLVLLHPNQLTHLLNVTAASVELARTFLLDVCYEIVDDGHWQYDHTNQQEVIMTTLLGGCRDIVILEGTSSTRTFISATFI